MKTGALSRREWLVLGTISAGALGLGQYLRRGRPLGRDVSTFLDVPAMADAPGFPSEGPLRAAVTMLVFSDYACGVCRAVEPLWRAAVAEAASNGTPVRVVHRDWPILGPASLRAARVALAADRQGIYDLFHDTLMRTGRHEEAALRAAVAGAGGSWARLEADLATHAASIDQLLGRTAQDAFQLGFRGTPGFLVGPIRIEGGASQRQFAEAIERAGS